MHRILFQPLYSLSEIPFVEDLAFFLSYPATYLVIFFLLVWALFVSKRRMYSFSLFVLTGVTAWFAAHFLKELVGLSRPYVELGLSVRVLEPGFSFPSEHTTVLTALAFAMLMMERKIGGWLLTIAILVGFSRVILGVHYPLDILGAVWLGYLVYLPYSRLFEKLLPNSVSLVKEKNKNG